MRTVTKDNCLATVSPRLASEWHPTKNGKLVPWDIIANSSKKVWWQCSKKHAWLDSLSHRLGGRNCPYCSNRKANKENSFAFRRPDLLKEWDYKKNKNIDPANVVYGSTKKVWWICAKEHSFLAQIRYRYKGSGCPYCSICPKKIDKTNCLATLNPKLAKEWHPTKNGKLTPYSVAQHSNLDAWWECEKHHIYKSKIYSRSAGNNCPYCSGKKVCLDNCLATIEPLISKEWDYQNNGDLTPYDVTCSTHKKVSWICSLKEHRWMSSISNRTGSRRRGCPQCNGITLKDDVYCDSIPEAYMYLVYEKNGKPFLHHGHYSGKLKRRIYDFYFPEENKYVEITSYPKRCKKSNTYLAKIIKKYYKNIRIKKNFVENILKAKFELVYFVPNKEQIKYVRENSK